jgi:hypothetical protein
VDFDNNPKSQTGRKTNLIYITLGRATKSNEVSIMGRDHKKIMESKKKKKKRISKGRKSL